MDDKLPFAMYKLTYYVPNIRICYIHTLLRYKKLKYTLQKRKKMFSNNFVILLWYNF